MTVGQEPWCGGPPPCALTHGREDQRRSFPFMKDTISLVSRNQETSLISLNLCLPEFPGNRALRPLSSHCGPILSSFPHFPRSLTGKVLVETPRGHKCHGGYSGQHQRGGDFKLEPFKGIPFQSPGPAGPRKGQPLPFWWPTYHNISHSACHSLRHKVTPQTGDTERDP